MIDTRRETVIANEHGLSVSTIEPIFKREVARARTFGFTRELDDLLRQELALVGSERNAVIVGVGGVVNDEGLRFDDEFVRHKILDVVGDLGDSQALRRLSNALATTASRFARAWTRGRVA